MHHFQFILLFVVFSFVLCECVIRKYYCNFDLDLVGNCTYNEITGTKPLHHQVGGLSVPANSPPSEPLSDVKSIRKLNYFIVI